MFIRNGCPGGLIGRVLNSAFARVPEKVCYSRLRRALNVLIAGKDLACVEALAAASSAAQWQGPKIAAAAVCASGRC